MKAKLIIDDKEIENEITEEEYKKIQPPKEKKTGYERVPNSDIYFYVSAKSEIAAAVDLCDYIDDKYYNSANYYSSKNVAKNNARADKLMRQLRRFAVEHRGDGVNLNDTNTKKYCIYYNYINKEIGIWYTVTAKNFGVIYFNSEETAQAAINAFRDELIWYFTKYEDSL